LVIYGGSIYTDDNLCDLLTEKSTNCLKKKNDIKERETQQKWFIVLSTLLILAIFLILGFDKRLGWSNVSVWISIHANCFVFIGYMFFILTVRTNEFAARTVSVEEGQKVVSSGVYSIVRHPMYLAMTIIFCLNHLLWDLIGHYYRQLFFRLF